jgi:hypothetical protein
MESQIVHPNNQAQGQLVEIGLEELNNIVGNLKNFYFIVLQMDWYLPKLEAKTITSDYLYGVMVGKYFRIQKNDVKLGVVYRRVKKIDLYYELRALGTPAPLGFEVESLPDFGWLANILYTLSPNHQFFRTQALSGYKRLIPAKSNLL